MQFLPPTFAAHAIDGNAVGTTTPHNPHGPNCVVSNHWYGRATDIIAINPPDHSRAQVNAANPWARNIVDALTQVPPDNPLRPTEVGSPFPAYHHHGHFHNANHRTHLHIGWDA